MSGDRWKRPRYPVYRTDDLKSARVVEAVGVVSPCGYGHVISQEPPHSDLKIWFTLDAWRTSDAEVCLAPLTLQKTGPFRTLEKMRDSIVPFTVMKVRARIEEDPEQGGWQGVFEGGTREVSAGPELANLAADWQRPLKAHRKLGTFQWQSWGGAFESQTKWKRQPVRLVLQMDTREELSKVVDVAHELWSAQDE